MFSVYIPGRKLIQPALTTWLEQDKDQMQKDDVQ